MNRNIYEQYIAILEGELVPALGCTEPIAIALAAAKARQVLGEEPQKMVVSCSGNIIKNVKGVVVPNSGGLKGIDTSAVLGAVGGDPERGLEVLTAVTPADLQRARELLDAGICETELLEGVSNLQIIVEASAGAHTSVVEICYSHTNIVRVERDGEVLVGGADTPVEDHLSEAYELLDLADIYTFAETVDLDDVRKVISRQIEYNYAIAKEGLSHPYGAQVGRTLLSEYGDDVKIRARAWAAAGSDARMSGCALPVVTNSGSGNQGMTVCLPVLAYAQELGVSEEKAYRALVLSNLIAIYQKKGLGKLSAYCGAVSAAAASGAAITYLCGGDFEAICRTVVNTLADVSGVVCDGAKPSCAAKIASAVDAAILSHCMSLQNRTFGAGEGLVMNTPEETVQAIGRMGRVGMKSTDVEILNIMIGK